MVHLCFAGRDLCREGEGVGGGGGSAVQVKDDDGRVSTVMLTSWISACWLVSALKSEIAMLFRTSYQHSFMFSFSVQLEGLVAFDGKSVVGVQVCLLDAGHSNGSFM